MKCPVCSTELKMSERQGIEIDYCPQCRGVWLDRGELDKIIERSTRTFHEEYRETDDRHRNGDYKHDYDSHQKHKVKSFLKDIFD